jgi:hypothetical protein
LYLTYPKSKIYHILANAMDFLENHLELQFALNFVDRLKY